MLRYCVEDIGSPLLIALDHTYSELDELGVPNLDNAQGPPSQRWRSLMVEMFGSEHGQLLESRPDRASALRCVDIASEREREAADEILAAVTLFLVAEANTASEFAESLPDSVDDAVRDRLGDLAARIVEVVDMVDLSLEAGTWPELYDQPLGPVNTHLDRIPPTRRQQGVPARFANHSATRPTNRIDSARPAMMTATPHFIDQDQSGAVRELSAAKLAFAVSLIALPAAVVSIVTPPTLRFISIIMLAVLAASAILLTAHRQPRAFHALTELLQR